MPTAVSNAPIRAFHEAHGDIRTYRRWRKADAERLGARLHPVLRALAEADGWASYDGDSLWHCDPDDWAGVAARWMPEGTKQCDVLFRTGFGDLFVWDGTYVWLVRPHLSARMRITRRVDRLLGFAFQQSDFFLQDDLPEMMERARTKAGQLKPEEIYNYVPALALGGSEKKSRIVKAKAKEALDILAQLSPIGEYGIGAD